MELNYYHVQKGLNKSLGLGASNLFGWILSVCNMNGYCTASNNTMAEEIGVARRSVIKYLQKLVDEGYIEVEEGGGGITNKITIPDNVMVKMEMTVRRKKAPEKKKPDVPDEILVWRSLLGRYPAKALWAKIISNFKGKNKEQIQPIFELWCAQGWNPNNVNWTRWVKDGVPKDFVLKPVEQKEPEPMQFVGFDDDDEGVF